MRRSSWRIPSGTCAFCCSSIWVSVGASTAVVKLAWYFDATCARTRSRVAIGAAALEGAMHEGATLDAAMLGGRPIEAVDAGDAGDTRDAENAAGADGANNAAPP